MEEIPQYAIKPKLIRLLIPQFLKLVVLCGLFYLGILLNLYLLQIDAPSWLNLVVIGMLVLLLIIQILITHKKAQDWRYEFYSNRLDYFGDRMNSLLYSNIFDIKIKRNFFDLLSGTATIALSKDFKINYVGNYEEVARYCQGLAQAYGVPTQQSTQLAVSAAPT